MNKIRAIYRLLAFAVITVSQLISLVLRETFGGKSMKRREEAKMRWARVMEKVLGMEITMEGNPPTEGSLIAPNHRSYIDIVAVVKYTPGIYLAKASIKKWPIIGQAASYVDTLWIERKNKASRVENRNKIVQALREGKQVVIHPEGTTTAAPDMLDFSPGIFFNLAKSNMTATPVAIEYKYGDDAWVGDDTFLPHFMKCFGKKRTPVRIHFGPPMRGDSAEVLRKEVQEWVRAELARMRELLDFQPKYLGPGSNS